MVKRKYKGVPLDSFPLDQNDSFCVLANTLNWDELINGGNVFENGYSPIQPLRRIIGFILLESFVNKSGNDLLSQWLMIPYYQYFTGEDWFFWELPITVDEIENCKENFTDEYKDKLKEVVHSNRGLMSKKEQNKYNK